MSILKDIGLVQSANKSSKAFESLFGEKTFLEVEAGSAHDYVEKYFDKYKELNPSADNSLNGKMFELIIYTLFYRLDLCPMYLQAKVAFVPNVDYDCLLYSKGDYPLAFSLKTSLRERYKQADLEAIALKYVHRKAKCYLLTLNEDEARNVSNKIANGEVLGIDKVVLCTSSQLDDLIEELKQENFIEPGKREVIESNRVIRAQTI